jgi:tetratricopeptide (TPR) repeat protein
MEFLKKCLNFGRDTLYEEAICLFNQHNYKEAIEKFEEILKKKSSAKSLHHNLAQVYASQAHRNLGIILFTLGNFSAALEEFRKALSYNRGYTELHYFIGVCLNNMGDFDGAIQSFNTVLEVEPSNLPVRLKLGVVLHNLKMWDKAISLYENILRASPGYADIHFHLGLALLGKGNIADALGAFEKAIAINPNYLQARLKTAILLTYLGHNKEALETLTQLAGQFPDYADINYYLGIAHMGLGHTGDAMDCFLRAIEINPAYKEARLKLGVIYCHLERLDEGVKALEQACLLDPEDEDLPMIISGIRKMTETASHPGEELATVLGKICVSDEEIVRVLPEFNKYLQIGPEVSEMISIVATISKDDKELCEILIPFIKAYISSYFGYPDLHNSLGTLCYKLERMEEAETAFREAIRLNPDYLKARLNLFYTLRESGKLTEALEEGRYLSSKTTSYPDLHYTMGEVYASCDMLEEAKESLREGIRLNPRYWQAHLLMAEVHKREGNRGEAIAELKCCLDGNPGEEAARQIQEEIASLEAFAE